MYCDVSEEEKWPPLENIMKFDDVSMLLYSAVYFFT
jgi:hypothetical protein